MEQYLNVLNFDILSLHTQYIFETKIIIIIHVGQNK